MPIEGFVLLHPCGYYALYHPNFCHQLHTGDRLEIAIGETWLEMEVAHGLEGYYLTGRDISFYPMRVWGRLSPHPLTPSDGDPSLERLT